MANREFILATDLTVALNIGVGGAADPGKTRVTTSVDFNVGTNDLFVFRNGLLQVAGAGNHYIEEDATHLVFSFLLDATGPFIDELELRVAEQGSSEYIEPPALFRQVSPPPRPDNFGGLFSFV